MKQTIAITLILLFGLFSGSNTVSAQVTTLGNGLKCNGSTILQGKKLVSYSKAKSNIKKNITALKKSLKSAAKAKKKKIQANIASLQATELLVSSCFSGKLANTVDPVFTSLVGEYSGTYSGIVGGFIPVSGSVSASFFIQPGTTLFSGGLSLGGQLGAALNNTPLNFSGNVSGITFPAQFIIPSPSLGTVTVQVTQGGQLTIASSALNLDSQLTSSTIAGSLNGAYSGITFTGNFSMTK